MAEISVEQLGKAIARLEESVAAFEATKGDAPDSVPENSLNSSPNNLMIRDSVIKRVEFTSEVAQSLLRKSVPTYSVHVREREQLTYPTLIRTASQDGLLREGYDEWHSFREARNRSSHAYNEGQAVAVVAIVPRFLEEVKFLYGRLRTEVSA